ncbi:MAG: phage tail sheath family protein [Actinobacteria bacterium]|nr:phage tail sheath family protein [Actinomycetota bacterium]
MTHPGVYIEELPSGWRPIEGAPTSVTAFVGRTRRGPSDGVRVVQGTAEFASLYGGPWEEAPLGHAVGHYFANGGRVAVIARVHHGATRAAVSLAARGSADLDLEAAEEGAWGNGLRVRVERTGGRGRGRGPGRGGTVDLHVRDTATGAEETWTGLSTDPAQPRFVGGVLAASRLVRVRGPVPPSALLPSAEVALTGGDDGAPLTDADLTDPALAAEHRGLWLLDDAPDVNLVCIPPLGPGRDVGRQTWDTAVEWARGRRAIVLVDPPAHWSSAADAIAGVDGVVTRSPDAALYAPRLLAPDPLRGGTTGKFAPGGAVAGVIARTDETRGVWKAPAGVEAGLRGAVGVTFGGAAASAGDAEVLTPAGINALREVRAGGGPVVWGARTLAGVAGEASDWTYLPVRRTALFIAESIERGLAWTVFEPNGEPLWASVRLAVGTFIEGLFRAGAFQGASPREAFLVRCDRSTTTEADLANGEFTVLVGFAPLKPAEFVVLRVRARAGGEG